MEDVVKIKINTIELWAKVANSTFMSYMSRRFVEKNKITVVRESLTQESVGIPTKKLCREIAVANVTNTLTSATATDYPFYITEDPFNIQWPSALEMPPFIDVVLGAGLSRQFTSDYIFYLIYFVY